MNFEKALLEKVNPKLEHTPLNMKNELAKSFTNITLKLKKDLKINPLNKKAILKPSHKL